MKKVLFSFLGSVLLSQSVMAEDYPYLTFTKSDGSIQNVSVANLVMTVKEGTLVATNGDGTVSITLTDLSKMAFSSATAVDVVDATGVSGCVKVYSLGGVFIGEYSSADAARENLDKGIYIIKSNSKTSKITVQ